MPPATINGKGVIKQLAQNVDNEYAMIDEMIVPAHQHSVGAKKSGLDQAISRSKGGLSPKIHATVDALGNSTIFHLTPGQAHDLEGAEALVPGLEADALIADKARDADKRMIWPLREAGIETRHPGKGQPQTAMSSR